MKFHTKRFTIKRKQTGGAVTKHSIFKHILSIGYEIETSSLAKLTFIDEGEKKILLNTDTARKDLEKFSQSAEDVEFDDEEDEESYQIRQIEEMEIPAYDEHGNLDKSVSFMITNDQTESKLIKEAGALCETVILKQKAKQVKKVIKKMGLEQYKEELLASIAGSKEGKVLTDLEAVLKNAAVDTATVEAFMEAIEKLVKKNDHQYQYKRTDVAETYDIHFEFWNPVHCGTFADVEWVVTYEQPHISENIILDTFINVARNLLRHLDEYTEKKHGHLVFKYNTEHPIENPEDRILFCKPGSNTYYLQTHYTKRSLKNEELTLDDVCTTSQMTFSCQAHHLFPIMKELISQETSLIPSIRANSKTNLAVLKNIEDCVVHLLKEYNNQAGRYKIRERGETVEAFKNYLGLMLLKLFMYINRYLHQDPSKAQVYLKDKLFFNSRHSNYLLYQAMKKCLAELFQTTLTKHSIEEEEQALLFADIIQRLVIHEEVLLTHFTEEDAPLRKDVFAASNVLEKGSPDYGNPAVSLISYFQFFEDPMDDETNRHIHGGVFTYDWLEYSGIDKYSTKMDIKMHGSKQNKVLVEFRGFQRALIPYMWRIADPELRTNMTHGTCNILGNKYTNDITVASIYNLRKLVELYDAGPHPAGQPKKKLTKKSKKLKK
jgi:hypothetical protein